MRMACCVGSHARSRVSLFHSTVFEPKEKQLLIYKLDCLQSVSLSLFYRNNTRKEHAGHEIRQEQREGLGRDETVAREKRKFCCLALVCFSLNCHFLRTRFLRLNTLRASREKAGCEQSIYKCINTHCRDKRRRNLNLK